MDPRQATLPILQLDSSGDPIALAGTGFLLGPPSTLVTAAHVLRDVLPDGHSYGIAFPTAAGPKIMGIIHAHVRFSPIWDIAVLPRAGHPELHVFKLQPERVPLTDDVVAFDYSSTRFEKRDGKLHTFLEPLTHKGNLMRYYSCDAPGWEGMPAWDTSFPALQGASGAPIMAMVGGGVVGMLLANRERHLVPAQILRVATAEKEYEEVRYFLPTGLAIRAVAIGAFLESLGIDIEVIVHPDREADI